MSGIWVAALCLAEEELGRCLPEGFCCIRQPAWLGGLDDEFVGWLAKGWMCPLPKVSDEDSLAMRMVLLAVVRGESWPDGVVVVTVYFREDVVFATSGVARWSCEYADPGFVDGLVGFVLGEVRRVEGVWWVKLFWWLCGWFRS